MGLKNFLSKRKSDKFRKNHKIGLCLSGGGTRGISYIGVFKAFEEYNIKEHY
jgi:predicted acylesterase/phospholipase RssA